MYILVIFVSLQLKLCDWKLFHELQACDSCMGLLIDDEMKKERENKRKEEKKIK
jgi:hypothetical protein